MTVRVGASAAPCFSKAGFAVVVWQLSKAMCGRFVFTYIGFMY